MFEVAAADTRPSFIRRIIIFSHVDPCTQVKSYEVLLLTRWLSATLLQVDVTQSLIDHG